MIKSIHFQNFMILREATLPLGPFTLIVGPNGSGKSTAMKGLDFAYDPSKYHFDELVTSGSEHSPISVSMQCMQEGGETTSIISTLTSKEASGPGLVGGGSFPSVLRKKLAAFRVFSFNGQSLAARGKTFRKAELGPTGANLAGVLNVLNGTEPERFQAFNEELRRWLPEFERVVFDYPEDGSVELQLRTQVGNHIYPSQDLSHGTLLALAILTLAYLPSPPSVVCFEEPDQGIHPRLLTAVRDWMYRLAYPKDFGESRGPVQVIATTHSPYLLDLFKDHPEEIVIAQKTEYGAHFERLSDKPRLAEILGGTPLGDVWFSGVLGGVPANT